jgi:hypothetical protein
MTEEVKPQAPPYGLAVAALAEHADCLPSAVVVLPDHVLWSSSRCVCVCGGGGYLGALCADFWLLAACNRAALGPAGTTHTRTHAHARAHTRTHFPERGAARPSTPPRSSELAADFQLLEEAADVLGALSARGTPVALLVPRARAAAVLHCLGQANTRALFKAVVRWVCACVCVCVWGGVLAQAAQAGGSACGQL